MGTPLFQIAFPNPQDRETARDHVGILRRVQLHAATLARVWAWKTGWVAVPIVAVELNDKTARRHEGINAELTRDNILAFVQNAGLIQHSIPDQFQSVRGQLGLEPVQLNKHVVAIGVCIPTRNRAVCWVSLFSTRWGPLKGFATHLARKTIFMASLPLIRVLLATKEILCRATLRNLYRRPAHGAVRLDLKSRPIDVAAFSGARLLPVRSAARREIKSYPTYGAFPWRLPRANAFAFEAAKACASGSSSEGTERRIANQTTHQHATILACLSRYAIQKVKGVEDAGPLFQAAE